MVQDPVGTDWVGRTKTRHEDPSAKRAEEHDEREKKISIHSYYVAQEPSHTQPSSSSSSNSGAHRAGSNDSVNKQEVDMNTT